MERESRALWDFVKNVKVNDVIFVRKGGSRIIGKGVVTSDYRFEKTRKDDYRNIRSVNWLSQEEFLTEEKFERKTLVDITDYKDKVERLESLFLGDEDEDEDEVMERPVVKYAPYSADDFLNEVYMSKERYDELVELLRMKKNVILQGAPGVGKTFIAERLAYSMIGEKNPDRVEMIQFHQSYSYEDFIMGYRPTERGFELKDGAFYKFCKKAQEVSENEYFFIIDEINRGNLNKIFGELFMLIESDKRDKRITLLYKDENFSVPSNVHLIGLMNTADRSLAMVDFALRRRFAFITLQPGFETEGFKRLQTAINHPKFDRVVQTVKELNAKIIRDKDLGDGFCVGHSFFCVEPENFSENWLRRVVHFELIPLLREYWFDAPDEFIQWETRLRSVVE